MQSITVLKKTVFRKKNDEQLKDIVTEFITMNTNPNERQSGQESIIPNYRKLHEYLQSIGMDRAAKHLYNNYSFDNSVIISETLKDELRNNGFNFTDEHILLFLTYINFKRWNKFLLDKYSSGSISLDSFTIANDFFINKNSNSELFTFIKGNNDFKLMLEDSQSNRVAVSVHKTSEHYSDTDNVNADALAAQLMQHITRLQAHYHTIESEMVEKFQAEIARERNSDVVEAFKKVAKFNTAGWSIYEETQTSSRSGTVKYYGLIYKDRVTARQVAVEKNVFHGGSDKTLIIIPIPDDAKKRFWVSNIKVPLQATIHDVMAYGYHPHRERSNAREQYNSLCIGDLAGKPFDEIVKLPKAFETIYFHSMHMGAARNYVDRLVYELREKYRRGDAEAKKLIDQSGEATVFSVGTHFNT